MTNNSEEEKEGQQKLRLYIIHLDGCNHTRIVNAQYLRDTVHKLAGQYFCICQSKLAEPLQERTTYIQPSSRKKSYNETFYSDFQLVTV
jgi:hypothetical protein